MHSFVVLFVVLLTGFSIFQGLILSSSGDTHDLREVFNGFSKEVQLQLLRYVDQLESNSKNVLNSYFQELDSDQNGCITKEEFKGVSLSLLASLKGVELPSFPPVPELASIDLPSSAFVVSWVFRVLRLQIGFLILLYVLENICSVFRKNPKFHIDKYEEAKPPHYHDAKLALKYDTPLTLYERCKMFFFVITGLLFVRMILAAIFFVLAAVVVNLSSYGGRTRSKNPIWFSLCSCVVSIFGGFMLASIGFGRIAQVGIPASASEARLLVGNHVCMIELVNLYLTCQFPAFVSRVENLSIPLFQGICKASDAIVVDRLAATSRSKTMEEIVQRTKCHTASQLMVFPEGTTNNQHVLFQFKRGAFEPGQPLQMVCSKFPYRHFNPCWTGRSVGGNDLIDLCLRLGCQFVNRMEVIYLPVYKPTEEEVANPVLFARHCQQMMAHVLGIATSDATYQNYVDAAKAFNKTRKVIGDSPGSSRSESPHQTPGF